MIYQSAVPARPPAQCACAHERELLLHGARNDALLCQSVSVSVCQGSPGPLPVISHRGTLCSVWTALITLARQEVDL